MGFNDICVNCTIVKNVGHFQIGFKNWIGFKNVENICDYAFCDGK